MSNGEDEKLLKQISDTREADATRDRARASLDLRMMSQLAEALGGLRDVTEKASADVSKGLQDLASEIRQHREAVGRAARSSSWISIVIAGATVLYVLIAGFNLVSC